VLILGASLAHAELHMGLAAIFRRFTFELYETDVTDVVLAHDFFLPCPKLDSKGVRVKVKVVDA
jgi:cytochrome P450